MPAMTVPTLYSMDDDGRLMRRLAEGDEAAVRDLYARFGGAVFGLARRMLGDHHLAEEAAQQTFVQAYRAAPRFDGARGGLASWLYQICRRASIDVYRKERHHQRAVSLENVDAGELTVLPPSIEGAWERWQVDEAVAALPAHQRAVIALCSYEGYTHTEAAKALGVPVGTVKSRLFKAYRALGSRLGSAVEAPDAV